MDGRCSLESFLAIRKVNGKRALATKASLSMAQLDMRYDGSKLGTVLAESGVVWTYEPVKSAITRTAKAYLSV